MYVFLHLWYNSCSRTHAQGKEKKELQIILKCSWQSLPCNSGSVGELVKLDQLQLVSTGLGIECGHRNLLINRFWPAATNPPKHLCFLSAYGSWLHQSMTGLPRFSPSNGYKMVFFANFSKFPHYMLVLPERPPRYELYGRASAAIETQLPYNKWLI